MYKVVQSGTEVYRVVEYCTEFCRVLQNLQSCRNLYRDIVLQCCTEFTVMYNVVQLYTKM